MANKSWFVFLAGLVNLKYIYVVKQKADTSSGENQSKYKKVFVVSYKLKFAYKPVLRSKKAFWKVLVQRLIIAKMRSKPDKFNHAHSISLPGVPEVSK